MATSIYRSEIPRRLNPVARWFLPALLLTLAAQAGIYYLLRETPFDWFTARQLSRPAPRAMNIKQVNIDPKLLDLNPEKAETPTKPKVDVTKMQIPGGEKPSFEKMMAQAETVIAAPQGEKTMVQEKPPVEQINPLDFTPADNNPPPLPPDVKALTEDLFKGKPMVTGSHPSIDLTGDATTSRPSAGPNVGAPNFSNLEGLLASQGPLTSKTAPILLPTDLLFDYDSAILRDAAVGSLQKLGELIQRNPQATFVIEGHTDNFGAPEYNQRLSLARAESVKDWLAHYAGIDPARIQTRGFGASKLLVRGGSVDEQRLNRRVEIVIKKGAAPRP